MKSIFISTSSKMQAPEDYVIRILSRKLRERGIDIVNECNADSLDLSLGVANLGKIDSFKIEAISNSKIGITGNDQRGLLYGVGKFLRECHFGNSEFEPCKWTGFSAPAKSVRGMYFATHFHNYYHDAPVQAIQEYVEDLALLGCNAINSWYDMHHYTGIDDPAAQEMIKRLKIILGAAKRIGLQPCTGTLANEGYSTTPEHLKSVPTQSAHYGVEICPSKPGGMELILKLRREMLEAFKEVEPELVWIWPYDQGGCACDKCKPWSINGYLRSGKAVAELIKEIYPNVKTIGSTWCFDYFYEGEYAGFQKAIESGEADWVDYLTIDAHDEFPPYILEHGVPGGVPALNFTEISMYRMYPWGGFGANPLPAHIQQMWDTSGHLLSGGFPYSEGIFEDINKAICLQLYWDPDKKVSDIVNEYACFEYGGAEDIIQKACYLMESGQNHWTEIRPVLEYSIQDTSNAVECLNLIKEASAIIPDWAKLSWRWRILFIRAALDAELAKSGGKSTPEADEMFEELSKIFYADNAELTVCPPSLRHLNRIFGK